MESTDLSKEDRDKLIIDNIPLVKSMINKYVYIGDDEIDDLIQVGMLSLTLAAYKFDASLNIKFSTYACNHILYGISNYKRLTHNKYRGLHISRNDIDLMYKMSKYLKDNSCVTEQEKELISKELNIDKSKIDKLCISITSLDEKIENDNGDTVGKVFDLGYIDCGYDNVITSLEINRLLETVKQELSNRDYSIIKDLINQYIKHGDTISRKELAKKYNICEPTLRRIIDKFKNIYYNERK